MNREQLLKLANGAEPWDKETAEREHRIAMQLLSRHDGHGRSVLEKENCAACVLHGYEPRGGFEEGIRMRTHGPNYSGWLRVWVQATGGIPSRFNEGLKRELETNDNEAYLNAFKRDIVTYCK